jgi:glucose/arabinose dehydrogenase
MRRSERVPLFGLGLSLLWLLGACGDDEDQGPEREAGAESGTPTGGREGAAGAGWYGWGRGAGTTGDGGAGNTGGTSGASQPGDTTWATQCGAPPEPATRPGNPCPSGDPARLKTTRVGTGFDVALYVAPIPGDDPRMLVVERGGTIQLLDPQSGDTRLFLDMEERPAGAHELLAASAAEGEQGLLGLAFHPDFPRDRRVFVNYTARAGDDVTAISSFEVESSNDAADPESEVRLLEFEQPQGNHNGGMLAFGPDGCLFIGSGDGGQANDVGSGHAPGGNGQSLATNLGKILRMDVDRPTARPAGNLESASVPHVWDYGMRNPWRFSFDRATGDMYIGDVGQGSWEEVDVEPRGHGKLNYGWPIMEGDECRNGDGCSRDGLALPIDQYETTDETNAIIGGYVYRGANIPSLAGWYLYGDNGAMRDGKVSAFVWDGEARCDDRTLDLQARDPLELDSDLTSFGEDEQGELYIVTRHSVYRIDAMQ